MIVAASLLKFVEAGAYLLDYVLRIHHELMLNDVRGAHENILLTVS